MEEVIEKIKKYIKSENVEIEQYLENQIRLSFYDNSIVIVLEKKEQWECKYYNITDDIVKLYKIYLIDGCYSTNDLSGNFIKNIRVNGIHFDFLAIKILDQSLSTLRTYINTNINKTFFANLDNYKKIFEKFHYVTNTSEPLKFLEMQCVFIEFIAFIFNFEAEATRVVGEIRTSMGIADPKTSIIPEIKETKETKETKEIQSRIIELDKLKTSILHAADMKLKIKIKTIKDEITTIIKSSNEQEIIKSIDEIKPGILKIYIQDLIKAKAKAKAESKAEQPKADPKAKSKADPKAKSKADPKAKSKAELLDENIKEIRTLEDISRIISKCSPMFTDYDKCVDDLIKLGNMFKGGNEQTLITGNADVLCNCSFLINKEEIRKLVEHLNRQGV